LATLICVSQISGHLQVGDCSTPNIQQYLKDFIRRKFRKAVTGRVSHFPDAQTRSGEAKPVLQAVGAEK
jgi:hypothetical protein